MSSCEHPIPVPHNKVILFVGSLWYRPNVEGIDWFLLRVWPQVLALEPDATLILAGAAPKEVRAVWETYPGVSAPGFVSDLAATYQHANLVIVPLHSGGGTNIKVIEALAHGRPCLISSFVEKAFDGHLVHDADLLVADSAREFCAKTLLVLSANVNVQQIADSGRVAVRKYFTVDAFKTSVTDFVQLPLSSLP